MGKTLVLAEKPSVGRNIARVLNCSKKGNGYIEGSGYIVTWALGHLVTLADPDAYDDKYKTWKMEDLPMLPKNLKLVVIKQSGKQFKNVKDQLNRKDVDEIVIATDAGREGELVARWILEKVHVKKPLKRLWISSVTDGAIKNGFSNLKDAKDYENLYAAAVARSEADWFVGLNVTRALTCKYNAQLSAGRVQTPTLSLIVEREEEIKNFKPKTYYGITANAGTLKLKWQRSDGNFRTFNEAEAEKINDKIKEGTTGKIIDINESEKKQFPKGLYDLTELQRDGNRLFGFSPKETLSIMQRLYENYKLLTYPRTDSRYIPKDVVKTLPERLKSISIGKYSRFAGEILRNKIKTNKSFVDDSKVSDHHAIIPTEERVVLSKLSSEEMKIYDLVVKRFLSVMMPPFEYINTTVKVEVSNETFVAKGKVVKSKGWKNVYDRGEDFHEEREENDDLKDQILPRMNSGDALKISSVRINKGETKPPARFNEGTLLSAMETPQKFIKLNSEYAKTLGETGGLGTVATRADIIEKLYNTFYIEKKGKDIYSTSKGRQVIDLVPSDLKSPILTAKWEKELDLISKGNINKNAFVGNMKSYASKLVDDVKASNDKFKYDNLTGTKCPNCGKYMLEVKNKHGKMLVCQDRNCGFRKNVSKFTNIRCPECHKKLELRGDGEGRIYVCPNCSFREKYSSFENRFKQNNKKLNKREVSQYMKKMKVENEAPVNSALADALAKLKLK
ncbi:MAG: DNA topoisomerase III [Clostridium sp.]|nr:DNA topoisomerase III [Clostridium sp.]